MKYANEHGQKVDYTGLAQSKLEELDRLISEHLSSHPTVLMAIVANHGVGKSLLGKYFRNHGIASIHRRKIAVIDDDNMAVVPCFFSAGGIKFLAQALTNCSHL